MRALISTRNVVERSYGVLKRRFPILHSGMQLKRVDAIQAVVTASCILHNMCIDLGDMDMDDFENVDGTDPEEAAPPPPPQQPVGEVSRGNVRDEIVAIFAQRINIENLDA